MQAAQSVVVPIALAEIFPVQAIVMSLTQRTKQGVIAELVHRLAELAGLAEGEEQALVESILAREKMGSTALQRPGVSALPHNAYRQVHRHGRVRCPRHPL